MLKIPYEYGTRKFLLAPYNTEQEKNLLLLDTIDTSDLGVALMTAGVESSIVDILTRDEKFAMLYKLRELSNGTDINTEITCADCNKKTSGVVSIEHVITKKYPTNPLIVDAHKQLTTENMDDFLRGDIDEMEFDEYDQVTKEVADSVTSFNFSAPLMCEHCNVLNYVVLNDEKFCISVMSETTLSDIYQAYNDMVFFGHYTKHDIDSLFPFERVILISMLNKTKEDLNNG